MGLIVLHSGHFSKIFKRLMGTPCSLHWREAGERERIWVLNPSHPIARDLGPVIEVPAGGNERMAEHAASLERLGLPHEVPQADSQLRLRGSQGTPRSSW